MERICEFADFSWELRALIKVDEIFLGKWEEKNWLNVPGPFYGAATDTCETGPIQAPDNVLLDEHGQEFVFRQPASREELIQVVSAAYCDPFLSYGADGNERWTPELVRMWWGNCDEIKSWVERQLAQRSHSGGYGAEATAALNAFRTFLETRIEDYLRTYMFFLSAHRAPTADELLPAL